MMSVSAKPVSDLDRGGVRFLKKNCWVSSTYVRGEARVKCRKINAAGKAKTYGQIF